MSDKRVKFQDSTGGKGSSRSYRGRELGHDSGVGSSSSEQASFGGRPDRRFTGEDYEDQLNNVGALQEALGQANQKVERLEKQCADLDAELTRAHRDTRETEKLYREECERTERLQLLANNLEAERVAQEEQIVELKLDYDEMRDQRDEFRAKYLSITDPVIDSTMRGGSGEPSSPRLRRSGSKHDLKGQKEPKGSTRKSTEQREEKASSVRQRHRSPSVSVRTGARSSSKKPYIERMPRAPSPSSRYAGNYITGPANLPPEPIGPAFHSCVPRTSQPPGPSSYPNTRDYPQTGNYIPYPLHDHRGEQRGRRRD